MVLGAGLEEFPVECGGGAQFSADCVVMELINSLKTRPSHVHLQIMGDGFRAMHSTNIVSVGARLLIESEAESGDTSFTAIANMDLDQLTVYLHVVYLPRTSEFFTREARIMTR